MAADDFLEPEVAVAVAVCSPAVRKVLRTGLVYGLAGFIVARDKLSDTARAVKKNVQHVAASGGIPASATSNEVDVAAGPASS